MLTNQNVMNSQLYILNILLTNKQTNKQTKHLGNCRKKLNKQQKRTEM